MKLLLIPLLLMASAHGLLTTAFKMEDVAVYLPLLRSVQPRACPANEMWQPCTANCSDCARRRSCVVSECEPGCDCLPRYFRVEPGGPCVPVALCPRPDCGPSEVFRECGPVCERCGTLRCRLISCDHRCYCRQGHLRDEEGQCVPEDECPNKRSTCSHNEEWLESGSDEYCLREDGEEEGASNATQSATAGCYCREGYKRNAFGSCVRASSCPGKCLGVAEYRACVPKCGATCRSDGEEGCEEDGNCYPGCFCPAGHVMNDFNNCIPKGDCTTDTPDVKIVRGSGIMAEESAASEATPAGEEGTTTTEPSDTTDGTFEDGQRSEDVGQTESASVDAQTEATTGGEDFANEDI